MTGFKQADIVLVRFPFTDLSSTKKRPAVIVSADEYAFRYSDYVLVPLTSVQQKEDCCIAGWKAAGLLKPTWAKAMIVTLAEEMLIKTIGRLDPQDVPVLSGMIRSMLAKEFQ